MKFILRNTTIFVFTLLIISCNGQVIEKKQSQNTKKTSEIAKIPVPKNGFSNAHVDKDNSLWFSSNGGGVYHFDGKAFINYTVKDGLSSNQVYSITSDHKNNLWFGTQSGLSKYNRKQFEHISLPYQDTTSGWIGKVYPVLSPNAAHSLATDNDNNLWIGTAGGGAYKYDGKNFKPYLTEIGRKQEDSLYHNWIPFIRKDSKGNMWFASMTHGGVSRYDGEKFTHYMPEDGLSDDMVRTIFKDSSGKLWFGFNGSRKSGLTYYDGKTFTSLTEKDGLCNTNIQAIYEDKNDRIWLGSDRGNICLYDGKQFIEFKAKDGRRFDRIRFIIEDNTGNIWFGGKNGLWKYDSETVTQMTK
jgi:ligand-binding sensor domain-containing protein